MKELTAVSGLPSVSRKYRNIITRQKQVMILKALIWFEKEKV